jgi:hypothetical protein
MGTVISLASGAAPAGATTGYIFGFRYLEDGCCSSDLQGSKASITTPSVPFKLPPNALAAGYESVEAEGFSDSSVYKAIQIGFHTSTYTSSPVSCDRTGNNSMDYFMETVSGGIYACTTLGSAGTNVRHAFNVRRTPGTDQWLAFLDGSGAGSQVSFNKAGLIRAGGELQNTNTGDAGFVKGWINESTQTCCHDPMRWQRQQGPDFSWAWYDIRSSHVCNGTPSGSPISCTPPSIDWYVGTLDGNNGDWTWENYHPYPYYGLP